MAQPVNPWRARGPMKVTFTSSGRPGESRVLINGVDITSNIRSIEVRAAADELTTCVIEFMDVQVDHVAQNMEVEEQRPKTIRLRPPKDLK